MGETRFIQETNVPGAVTGRLVTLDPRINIDDYDPKHPEVLWYCDNCDAGQPITAEFVTHHGWHLTLCETCLQNALNGIAYSRANPVSFDDPNYGKPAGGGLMCDRCQLLEQRLATAEAERDQWKEAAQSTLRDIERLRTTLINTALVPPPIVMSTSTEDADFIAISRQEYDEYRAFRATRPPMLGGAPTPGGQP